MRPEIRRKELPQKRKIFAKLFPGDVADKFTAFNLRKFKRSFGFGLRVKFNQAEKVTLRVDYGRGKDTNGIYFGREEAF